MHSVKKKHSYCDIYFAVHLNLNGNITTILLLKVIQISQCKKKSYYYNKNSSICNYGGLKCNSITFKYIYLFIITKSFDSIIINGKVTFYNFVLKKLFNLGKYALYKYLRFCSLNQKYVNAQRKIAIYIIKNYTRKNHP